MQESLGIFSCEESRFLFRLEDERISRKPSQDFRINGGPSYSIQNKLYQ